MKKSFLFSFVLISMVLAACGSKKVADSSLSSRKNSEDTKITDSQQSSEKEQATQVRPSSSNGGAAFSNAGASIISTQSSTTVHTSTITQTSATSQTSAVTPISTPTSSSSSSSQPIQYTYLTPTYVWEDDFSKCYAERECVEDSSLTQREISISQYEVVTPPTCEGSGVGRFIAYFVSSYFATQTHDVILNPINHNYSAPIYQWNEDYSKCTAKMICANDSTHIIEETVNSTYEVLIQPTLDSEGSACYTATFTNASFATQKHNVRLDKLVDPNLQYLKFEEYTLSNGSKRYKVVGFEGEPVDLVIPTKFKNVDVDCVEAGAFRDCKTLRSIVVPFSVNTIGNNAFAGCSNLESMVLSRCSPAPVYSLSASITYKYQFGLFFGETEYENSYPVKQSYWGGDDYYCYIPNGLKRLTINDYVSPGNCAGLTSLEEVTVKGSLIGNGAFNNCPNIKKITLGVDMVATSVCNQSDIETLVWKAISGGFYNPGSTATLASGGGAFKSVKDIIVEEGVKEIKDYAFKSMHASSISLPNSLNTIGKQALCENDFTELTIPESVMYIYENAFTYCNYLKAINYNAINSTFRYSGTYPSSGTYPFIGCTEIEVITIGDKVTEINGNIFSSMDNCTYIVINFSKLHLVQGGTGYGNVALYAIKVYNQGDYSFASDDNFKYINVDQDKIIISYLGTNSEVAIPEGVTAIGRKAFFNNASIVSVSLPNTLKEIGESAFQGCSLLTNINLPNSLEKIDKSAFQNCSKLNNITLPSNLKVLGNSAFYNCSALSNLAFGETFGEALTEVNTGTFSGTALPMTTYENGIYVANGTNPYFFLTAIDGGSSLSAFTIHEDCYIVAAGYSSNSKITSMVIPDNVMIMQKSFMTGFSKLVTITIGKSLRSFVGLNNLDSLTDFVVSEQNNYLKVVNHTLFNFDMTRLIAYPANNSEITTYTVPETVEVIGQYAFGCNKSIRTINVAESVKTIEQYAFIYAKFTTINIEVGLEFLGTWSFYINDSSLIVNYGGTNEQFDSIVKEPYWYGAFSQINCSDGAYTISK